MSASESGNKRNETPEPIFSPEDVQRRWRTLKAMGKVPPLDRVLQIVRAESKAGRAAE